MADQADLSDAPQDPEAEPSLVVVEDVVTVRVRRSPKYSVFLLVGAMVGLLAALILTFAFDGTGSVSPNTGLVYTQTQVFGFLALICIVIGITLGGLVALVLDRRLSRRTREIAADRESARLAD